MNKTCLIGNLVRDPQISYTGESQMAVARFTIAINRMKKDGGADFPNIVVFGKQAENCEKYLRKGSKVAVEGRIQTGSYEREDGTRVYTTDIVAERVEFLNRAEGQESRENRSTDEYKPSGRYEEYDPREDFAALDETNVPF